jgi:hypothetical protein
VNRGVGKSELGCFWIEISLSIDMLDMCSATIGQDGKTPLEVACSYGNPRRKSMIQDMLRAAGAKVYAFHLTGRISLKCAD